MESGVASTGEGSQSHGHKLATRYPIAAEIHKRLQLGLERGEGGGVSWQGHFRAEIRGCGNQGCGRLGDRNVLFLKKGQRQQLKVSFSDVKLEVDSQGHTGDCDFVIPSLDSPLSSVGHQG